MCNLNKIWTPRVFVQVWRSNLIRLTIVRIIPHSGVTQSSFSETSDKTKKKKVCCLNFLFLFFFFTCVSNLNAFYFYILALGGSTSYFKFQEYFYWIMDTFITFVQIYRLCNMILCTCIFIDLTSFRVNMLWQRHVLSIRQKKRRFVAWTFCSFFSFLHVWVI
jgi:hypothetical protein